MERPFNDPVARFRRWLSSRLGGFLEIRRFDEAKLEGSITLPESRGAHDFLDAHSSHLCQFALRDQCVP